MHTREPPIDPKWIRVNTGTLVAMTGPVKPQRRSYNAPRRAAGAAATRHAVLAAARDLFADRGYAATSVADIAAHAGVAVDTVYSAVGRKPEVMRALVEAAISGTDDAVPAQEREYVRRIQQTPDAAGKLTVYARAVAAIGQRMAAVHRALREAAVTDPACAALRKEIAERRAANMLLFAADLRATGEVRADLTDRQVADVVWSMNDADYYALLVAERGWSPRQFADWLSRAWVHTLLADPGAQRK
jgi:AcrR family transcriptional regulator